MGGGSGRGWRDEKATPQPASPHSESIKAALTWRLHLRLLQPSGQRRGFVPRGAAAGALRGAGRVARVLLSGGGRCGSGCGGGGCCGRGVFAVAAVLLLLLQHIGHQCGRIDGLLLLALLLGASGRDRAQPAEVERERRQQQSISGSTDARHSKLQYTCERAPARARKSSPRRLLKLLGLLLQLVCNAWKAGCGPLRDPRGAGLGPRQRVIAEHSEGLLRQAGGQRQVISNT